MDSNGGTWPAEPGPADPGVGARDDRLRMLRHMRQVWNALNAVRRERGRAEVEAARQRQVEAAVLDRTLRVQQMTGQPGVRGTRGGADGRPRRAAGTGSREPAGG
jgi:hypothetical protein